jgi:hypothetical protein
MSAYLIELRRSPLRWWLPGFIALDLAVLFGRSRWWIGVWSEASVAAQIPAFYLGPLFAAVSAYAAGNPHRRQFEEGRPSQSRGRWTCEATFFCSTLTFSCVPYLVGVLAAFIASVRTAGPGSLWLGYLFVGLAVVVGCTAIGHLAGRMFQATKATPIVSGIACLLIIVLAPPSMGLFVLSGYPNFRPNPSAVAVRVCLAIGFVALAILASSTLRSKFSRQKSYPALAVLTVVLAGIGIAMAHIGPVKVQRLSSKKLCSVGRHSFCIWPEHRKYLVSFNEMSRRLDAVPPGLFPINSRSYEVGLLGAANDTQGFSLLEGQTWQAGFIVAGQSVTHGFTRFCNAPTPALQAKKNQAFWELVSWLSIRIHGGGLPAELHGGPSVNMNDIERITKTSEESQAQWIATRKSIYNSTPCV